LRRFEPLGCRVFYRKSYGSRRCDGPRNLAASRIEGDHAIVARYEGRRGDVAARKGPVFDGEIVVRRRENKSEPEEEEGDDKGENDSHF
jgi:hypothetical protein